MAPLLGTAISVLGPVLKDVLGSGRAADKIMKEVELRAMDVDETLIKAQQSTLEKELNGDWMQRSWRPCLMFLFGFVIAFDLILIPTFNTIVFPMGAFFANMLWEPTTPFQPWQFPRNQIPAQVWTLLTIALPGYIASRSIEKVAKASGTSTGPGIMERLLGKKRPAEPQAPPPRTTVDVQVEKNDLPFDADIADIPLQRGD